LLNKGYRYLADLTPLSAGIFLDEAGLYKPPLGWGNNTVPGKNKKLSGGGGGTTATTT
jgi:hypothetical protein